MSEVLSGTLRSIALVGLLSMDFAGCVTHEGGNPGKTSCADDSCAGHGQCSDATGRAVCTCETGYTGDDCTGCASGYQDHDADGSCLPDCATAGFTCDGLGGCVDDSGLARCDCQAGFQDNDANGSCLPDCAAAGLTCDGHARCDDSGGEAVCACETGWDGSACDRCAEGYQDNDANDTCLPGCGLESTVCGSYGFCSDASGEVLCRCITGHTGESCDRCAEGYQDNDSDGACVPDCALSALNCGWHGQCDDTGGQPTCVCDLGHQGDDCGTCSDGYQDNDDSGSCLPTCLTAGLDCGSHGACADDSGQAQCDCQTGYAGATCESCAHGYQDNDQDGECLSTCWSANLSCQTHAHCEDGSGVTVCVCDTGYSGVDCDACADGYQDTDQNNSCLPTCQTAAGLCGLHGSCDDQSGVPTCTCQTGYTGDRCQFCAVGYQDNDHDGACEADCHVAQLNCEAHAHCSDSSGTAVCACDTGYAEPDCQGCADGFQDNDPGGICLPGCDLLAWTCSGHGLCDDANGQAVCDCDANYLDDGSGHCLLAGEGDTCQNALWLDLSQTVVSGDTSDSGAEYGCSCVGTTGEEQVYAFSLAQPVHITFETDGFDTVLYLRSTCDSQSSELACNDDGGAGNGSRISKELQAGTYFLFVDGFGAQVGGYRLSIDVDCGPGTVYDPQVGECVADPCFPNPCQADNQNVCQPILPDSHACLCNPGTIPDGDGGCMINPNPEGESCADVLSLTVGPDATIPGDMTGAVNDGRGVCAGVGPDRVYGFVLDEPMRVAFEMNGYDTVLHLRSECADPGSEIACDDDGGESNYARLVAILQPGSYFLWADSYGATVGAYELKTDFRGDPCAGDPCPGTPECTPGADWSTYTCECPAGSLPWAGDCVPDPCQPNPCTVNANRNRCVADLPGDYHCECNLGYLPNDADGDCHLDPNANEWAFLVFLNADNNLDDFGHEDLAEMGQAGSTPFVHIVSLFDTYAGPAQAIYIQPGGYDPVEDWGEVDMSDWQTLRDFGVWAVQHYPARHYALVMWDHGGGWKAGMPASFWKGFSNDDHGTQDEISISNGDYARALQGMVDAIGGGFKFDVIGFDACLMGMWEVAEATAPFAQYLVASEETEPGIGWAYHGFLPGLIANAQMTALDLARSIVDAYYNESASDETLAVIDLGTMDALAASVTAFSNVLLGHADQYAAIRTLRNNTQTFYLDDHRDLRHFAEQVAAAASLPADVRDAASALLDQLGISIAYSRAQSSKPNAYGLAIYFPTSFPDSAYQAEGALWSQRTTWDDFLFDFADGGAVKSPSNSCGSR